MALLVLLICIGLQRFLQLHHFGHQTHYLNYYYQWLMAKFKPITRGHGCIGVLVLLLPLLVVFSLIYVVLFHWLGAIAEFIISLVVVWLCIDGRDLSKSPYTEQSSANILVLTYERLFAIIFWFVIFSHLGIMPALLIYPMLISLRDYLQTDEAASGQILAWTKLALGVMDWVPMRLTGITFAMVGHFPKVFIPWCKALKAGICTDKQQVVDWGYLAIGISPTSAKRDEQAQTKLSDIVSLIDRTLVLWLALVALFTLGLFLG